MKLSMPRFDQAPVLVVGDVMLDRYWHGGTSRISPEAPVPVVKVEQIEDRPGGAANVALNIAALGAPAMLVGITGIDEAGQPIDVKDPLASRLRAIADAAGRDAEKLATGLLAVTEVFGTDLASNDVFAGQVKKQLESLLSRGAAVTIAEVSGLG